MRQRSVDILRLAGDLVLFLFRLGFQCTHIVQPVGNLDEHHANIVAHRQQQFTEVLRLLRGFVAKYAAGNLCQTVNDLRNLCAKQVVNVLNGIIGIFHHVVQQCCAYRRTAQTDLAHHDLCHSQWVHNILLAA